VVAYISSKSKFLRRIGSASRRLSVYYVYNPYAEASSSVAHDDHQPQEEHEPQPSHVAEPRPEARRRYPTRNMRRPQCGTGHHYGD